MKVIFKQYNELLVQIALLMYPRVVFLLNTYWFNIISYIKNILVKTQIINSLVYGV